MRWLRILQCVAVVTASCPDRATGAHPDCFVIPFCKDLINKAKQAHNEKKYSIAIRLYETARLHTADPRLLVLMGRSYQKSGSLQDAILLYRRAEPLLEDEDELQRLKLYLSEAEQALQRSSGQGAGVTPPSAAATASEPAEVEPPPSGAEPAAAPPPPRDVPQPSARPWAPDSGPVPKAPAQEGQRPSAAYRVLAGTLGVAAAGMLGFGIAALVAEGRCSTMSSGPWSTPSCFERYRTRDLGIGLTAGAALPAAGMILSIVLPGRSRAKSPPQLSR